MKYKFTHETEDYEDAPATRVTVETDAIELRHLIENFEGFLRACGFAFKGHVDIVEDEEWDIVEDEE